ncbi:MAG: DNA-binding protein, partial [Thermoprotei archaeon]
IPSRYPNAFESGYPGMYYDKPTAERAIKATEKIIEWMRTWLKTLGVRM